MLRFEEKCMAGNRWLELVGADGQWLGCIRHGSEKIALTFYSKQDCIKFADRLELPYKFVDGEETSDENGS